jgi:hypothetical protein
MNTKSKEAYWKSRAITWLLKESKIADIEEYMKEEANRLLCDTGQHEPPFSPERVALLRNVKRIEDAQIKNISELVPIKGGFIIRLNPQVITGSLMHDSKINGQSLRSRRFTIAHEIGHTYFYKLTSQIPSRPFNDYGSAPEERLCDIFATELLMPNQRFFSDAKKLIKKIGNHVEAISKLGSLYKITPQPIVLRLYELGILDKKRHVAIKWNYMSNPNEPQKQNVKLRIEWSYPYSYPYIPKYASTNPGSIFDRASHNRHLILEKSNVNIGGINGMHYVEALCIPSIKSLSSTDEASSNPVLSIIHLKDPAILL